MRKIIVISLFVICGVVLCGCGAGKYKNAGVCTSFEYSYKYYTDSDTDGYTYENYANYWVESVEGDIHIVHEIAPHGGESVGYTYVVDDDTLADLTDLLHELDVFFWKESYFGILSFGSRVYVMQVVFGEGGELSFSSEGGTSLDDVPKNYSLAHAELLDFLSEKAENGVLLNEYNPREEL